MSAACFYTNYNKPLKFFLISENSSEFFTVKQNTGILQWQVESSNLEFLDTKSDYLTTVPLHTTVHKKPNHIKLCVTLVVHMVGL